MRLGLYLDLAVGSRRGGGESWCEKDAVAQGVSLGAPPDHLNPNGQNWDITAYAPHKLAAAKYKSLRVMLAEAMRHAGILRVDHALGLNRSFWIPDDGSPGGYIRQPFEAQLAVIAMAAEATDTVVIGEDLGLVPDGFRQAMQSRGIYGYCVLQYEKNKAGHFTPPADLRQHSLACFGTHDTPTLKGYWKGLDIDMWHGVGFIDASEASTSHRQRKRDLQALMATGCTDDEKKVTGKVGFQNFYNKVHNSLAGSPVAMVSVQLDDVLGQEQAQNYPGTVNEYPNWRQKCSRTLEEIGTSAALGELGECMMENGRSSKIVTRVKE